MKSEDLAAEHPTARAPGQAGSPSTEAGWFEETSDSSAPVRHAAHRPEVMLLGIRRRDFLTVLGGTTGLGPFAARAQRRAMPVVGLLNPASPSPNYAPAPGLYLDAIHQGLLETGYVEGRNVALEYRWAEGDYDRLPALAADLVGRKVDVIVTNSLVAAQAAKNATATIPIVFLSITDPVGVGLIASLARPGGNLTGVTSFGIQLAPKLLDLLSELVPSASTIGLLVNPGFPLVAELYIRNIREAARTMGLSLSVQTAGTEGEIDAAFASFAQAKIDGLVIMADAWFTTRRDQIVALASRHAIPTIYYNVLYAMAGGLIVYGIDEVDGVRLAFVYVGKILNGANPAEMPIERPTKFRLIVNLKTAKGLGLTVPQSLLGSADEVIE